MPAFAISSGHGLKVRGASGYLDEVNEARKVVNRVTDMLNAANQRTVKFHDDTSTSQSQNLNTITSWHNRQSRDYDVSVHFNAYATTSKPMGTETLYVSSTGLSMAQRVSPAIARAGTFLDRGPKKRTDLAFLNNTNKPAILIEVCFVDSSADANLYRSNFEAICQAIAESMSGASIPSEPPPVEPPTEPPTTEPPPVSGDNQVNIVGEIKGHCSVYINGELIIGREEYEPVVDLQLSKVGDVTVTLNGQQFNNWPGTTEPPDPVDPPIKSNCTNVICTVFGGKADPNDSAYPPYDKITDTELSVALPYKFQGSRPSVRVINRANRQECVCQIRDVGPWLIDDNYWDTTNRSLAETCYLNNQPLPRGPHKGKMCNGAGIDITPGAAKAIGLSGKGNVDFQIIGQGMV